MKDRPTSLALALLGEFASDMREPRTINQLALSSGKAYANTHATATELLRENILIKEVVGHSHRCRLNLNNDKTLIYLSLLEMAKRDALLRKSPEARLLLAKIDEYGPRLGILLAWQREEDILLITTHHTSIPDDVLGVKAAVLPLAAFLHDQHLRATIGGNATLLCGHALYTSLLREVTR